MIGTHVGQYEVLERLGGGGFSTVYKAVPGRGGHAVAIKVLHAEYALDDQFVRRFEREAETLLGLPRHPHLIRCLTRGRTGNVPYLVMEYLDGQDVSQLLEQRGPLPVSEAVGIALQVADGLGAAHRANVVHRDVKPHNIRLTSSGVVKLIDFGVAHPPAGARLTRTGMFVGTPPYIAPEIWEGAPSDGRADLYALGVVLYELLTGVVPFDGDSPAAIMRQHLQGTPRPFALFRSDVPEAVEAVVLRALARDPAERFQSAEEFRAGLRAAMLPTPRLASPRRQTSRAQPVAVPAYLIGERAHFSLRPNLTMLGRHPESHILVDDSRVSAQHASIELQGHNYILRDLNSRNGTFLNGSRIHGPAVLGPGDHVRVGHTTFAFATQVAQRTHPNSAEARLIAALAHAGAVLGIANLIVPLVPLLLPLGIWAAAQGSSVYVARQARQALLFQACLAVLLLVIGSRLQTSFWLAGTACGWFAAARCVLGHDFRYPILNSLDPFERRRDAH
jgi:serine/threonine protein kinase